MTHVRETSAETYQQVKSSGLLGFQRQRTFDLLATYGSMTANELMKKAKELNPSLTHQAIESIGRRLSELRDMGVVKEIGKVKCPITNRPSIVWEALDSTPILKKKPLTLREKYAIAITTLKSVGLQSTQKILEELGE